MNKLISPEEAVKVVLDGHELRWYEDGYKKGYEDGYKDRNNLAASESILKKLQIDEVMGIWEATLNTCRKRSSVRRVVLTFAHSLLKKAQEK